MLRRRFAFTTGAAGFTLLVTSAYASAAILLIALSDRIVTWAAKNAGAMPRIQSAVGVSVVILSAMLLAALIYWRRAGLERTRSAAVRERRGKRLLDERQNLRHSSRALHEVLGVIGHELRTPLAGLRALAEFVLSEPDRNTPQVEEFLQSINDEVSRCSEMVNNMLEAARLESGVAKWSWTQFEIARVCEEAMEIVRPLNRAQSVRFTCSISPAHCALMGDPDAIRRLILNLLTNAVKHTPRGEIAIEVREAPPLHLVGGLEMDGASPAGSVARDHRWVRIRVRDTGSGIPPEFSEKLGRAFAANTGSVGSQYIKGAGLGLAICREIASAHGGHITVSSARHRGTTFTVLLRADLEGPVTGERIEEPIALEAAA